MALKTFVRRDLGKIFLLLSIAIFGIISCFRNDGLVDPSHSGDLTPLARFNGIAINVGDTAISATRIQYLNNPKIAVVWQFMGLRENKNTYASNIVTTAPPFKFAGTPDRTY